MPIEGILEKDEESDRVGVVLRENPKTMTEKELRRYERNMCPADSVSYTHLTLPTTPYV